jgi:hypothetical protein
MFEKQGTPVIRAFVERGGVTSGANRVLTGG